MIDPLSMQELAESLANELWNEPPQEQQQERHDQPQQCIPSPAGFSFVGDLHLNNADGSCPIAVSAGGSDNDMISFTAGSPVATGSIVGKCCSSSTTEKKISSGGRKPGSSVKEHVIAERKRREKMHHQFATLASIIPDITKVSQLSAAYLINHRQHKLTSGVGCVINFTDRQTRCLSWAAPSITCTT